MMQLIINLFFLFYCSLLIFAPLSVVCVVIVLRSCIELVGRLV